MILDTGLARRKEPGWKGPCPVGEGAAAVLTGLTGVCHPSAVVAE